MTEADWRATTDVLRLLLSLRKRQKQVGSDPERFRVFAIACVRRMWPFLDDDLRRAVAILERDPHAREAIAASLLTLAVNVRQRASTVLAAFHHGHADVKIVGDRYAELEAASAAWVVTVAGPFGAARGASARAIRVAGWAEIAADPPSDLGDRTTAVWSDRFPASASEQAAQADLLRCVFGNPFRPVAFEPAWRTEAVVALARGMDESRDFAALPVLADALEDAGCADAELLAHCRGAGPHARGCHAIDHVLGRW